MLSSSPRLESLDLIPVGQKRGEKGPRALGHAAVCPQDSQQVGTEVEVGFRSSESQPASPLPLKLVLWSLLAPDSNNVTDLQSKGVTVFLVPYCVCLGLQNSA